MKANELRIGNYIVWDSTGEVEIVKDIVTHGRKYHNINNVNIKDAKPIPLTEEWLVRFGFKYYGYWKYWQIKCENRLKIYPWKNGFDYRGTHHFEIKHVHQLQNLYFALTGEELILHN